MIDKTHDPALRCWVPEADGHPQFPIQNLPFGVFTTRGQGRRGGVAIGNFVLDMRAAYGADLFEDDTAVAAEAAARQHLNHLMSLGPAPRQALRRRLSALLDANGPDRAAIEPLARELLFPIADCTMQLAVAPGNFTDFFAGIHHAESTGALFRPDDPLPRNYKYMPLAYHGRASSIRQSGTPIRRPHGQYLVPGESQPRFAPSQKIDGEAELGAWIGAGNPLGEPIRIAAAAERVWGYSMINDWSARDIQAFEARPLGPFLGKSFLTTVSPWILTPEALEPFRCAQAPRPAGDPPVPAYLWNDADQANGALDITIELYITTSAQRAAAKPPQRLSRTSSRHLYWTIAQMIAHHTSNGCDLRTADLIGTGTISGPAPGSEGSLMEITRDGREPVTLGTGETRTYLEDSDALIIRAICQRQGFAQIGFGDCRGVVLAPVRY